MVQAEDAAKREKNVEESKKFKIEQDMSLPRAMPIKIRDVSEYHLQRVVVHAWVHRLRRQGKSMIFMVLRDGTGLLQCLLSNMMVSVRV